MAHERLAAISGITVLGALHLYFVGDGTVLGILIGSLITLAGVEGLQKTKS